MTLSRRWEYRAFLEKVDLGEGDRILVRDQLVWGSNWREAMGKIREHLDDLIFKGVVLGEFGLSPRYIQLRVWQTEGPGDRTWGERWIDYRFLDPQYQGLLGDLMKATGADGSCSHVWRSRMVPGLGREMVVNTQVSGGPCRGRCILIIEALENATWYHHDRDRLVARCQHQYEKESGARARP